LKNALQELGKLDSIETLDMRLIFVVPESQIDFKKQRITLPDLTSGLQSNVTQIHGIGAAHAAALAYENIYDVEGLAKKSNDERSNRRRGT
jgi:predicted flap endonuclease-1-like 5' DNA nuclease